MMTRPYLIKVHICHLFILLITAVSIANAAHTAKHSDPESFLWQYHYYGVLGKNTKISMTLGSKRDGQLVGYYSYLKVGAPISLSGKLAPDGSFDLVEKTTLQQDLNRPEKITGRMIGRADPSFQSVQGTWSSPDRRRSFSFKLNRAILVDSGAIENLPDNVGFLVISPDISLNSINSFCDSIGDTLDDHRSRKKCSLTRAATVGIFGEKEYRLAEFEALGAWGDGSSFEDSYSVLFEITNAIAKPFWMYKSIDDGSSLYEIKLLREGPYPVFEATYDSGGTRPSWHDFTIRRPAGFAIINTEQLELAIFDIAEEKGYETRSTLKFDFAKHQASNQLYKSNDPMCCGTAIISLSFDIVDDRMVLKDFKIIERK